MPLFPCPECGNACSTQAEACPKCGCPLDAVELAAPAEAATAFVFRSGATAPDLPAFLGHLAFAGGDDDHRFYGRGGPLEAWLLSRGWQRAADAASRSRDFVGFALALEPAHFPAWPPPDWPGYTFDRGYLSHHFLPDPAEAAVELRLPLVLVCNAPAASAEDVAPALRLAATRKAPLLLVVEDLAGAAALGAILEHTQRTALPCCAVKAPGYGDRRQAMLGDLAAVTGGRALVGDGAPAAVTHLRGVALQDLGRAERVVVSGDTTRVCRGKGLGDLVLARVRQVAKAMRETDSDYDREKLTQRYVNLLAGPAP